MRARSLVYRQRERGQTLAEFAIVAPLVIILIFGFVDLTRAYNAWVTIQGAAREGARYGVTGQVGCPGITNDRLACIQQLTKERTKPLTNSSSAVVVSVRSWKYPNYANPPTSNNPGGPCDALEVQVNYSFKPAFITAILGLSVPMTARERLVNEPFGGCG
jgi:Flp pilus assembly protein TadG